MFFGIFTECLTAVGWQPKMADAENIDSVTKKKTTEKQCQKCLKPDPIAVKNCKQCGESFPSKKNNDIVNNKKESTAPVDGMLLGLTHTERDEMIRVIYTKVKKELDIELGNLNNEIRGLKQRIQK